MKSARVQAGTLATECPVAVPRTPAASPTGSRLPAVSAGAPRVSTIIAIVSRHSHCVRGLGRDGRPIRSSRVPPAHRTTNNVSLRYCDAASRRASRAARTRHASSWASRGRLPSLEADPRRTRLKRPSARKSSTRSTDSRSSRSWRPHVRRRPECIRAESAKRLDGVVDVFALSTHDRNLGAMSGEGFPRCRNYCLWRRQTRKRACR